MIGAIRYRFSWMYPKYLFLLRRDRSWYTHEQHIYLEGTVECSWFSQTAEMTSASKTKPLILSYENIRLLLFAVGWQSATKRLATEPPFLRTNSYLLEWLSIMARRSGWLPVYAIKGGKSSSVNTFSFSPRIPHFWNSLITLYASNITIVNGFLYVFFQSSFITNCDLSTVNNNKVLLSCTNQVSITLKTVTSRGRSSSIVEVQW